jgi:hypothetical protein
VTRARAHPHLPHNLVAHLDHPGPPTHIRRQNTPLPGHGPDGRQDQPCRLRIALTDGHYQLHVLRLCAAGELGHQSRLAGISLSRDEGHLTLSSQSLRQELIQPRQLALTRDKKGPIHQAFSVTTRESTGLGPQWQARGPAELHRVRL